MALRAATAVRRLATLQGEPRLMTVRHDPGPRHSQASEASEAPPTPARSALMGRIRGRNTAPEIIVRRASHRLGLRFRVHRPDLPGTPDIVFPKHRLAIFVHGCFWHRHEGCRRCTTPKTRIEFWNEKFRKNVERDRRDAEALLMRGWKVLTIWECQTKNPVALDAILIAAVVGHQIEHVDRWTEGGERPRGPQQGLSSLDSPPR